MPYGTTQESKKTCGVYVTVAFDVGIARADLEYRSTMTTSCWFLFAVHGNGRRMSMVTNSNGFDGEELVVNVFVYSVCYFSRSFCKRLR